MSTRGEMSPPRRRRRTSSPAASLPDDEDLLQEILLRLPPRPSSLPRASLVCKLWRRLVAEPQFQRRFRDHHGKPPLLGFFLQDNISCPFVPMLDRPDRIPGARFSMPPHKRSIIIDCRHGLVLLRSQRGSRLFVWDPVAREKRRLVSPPGLDNDQMHIINGAVLFKPFPGGPDSQRQRKYKSFRMLFLIGHRCMEEHQNTAAGFVQYVYATALYFDWELALLVNRGAS